MIDTIAFVQCHYKNFKEAYQDDRFCMRRLQESGLFAHVVLAAADIEENRAIVPQAAKQAGVEFFLGDNKNLLKRMLDAGTDFQAEYLARVLPEWFYVDLELVRAMIETCREHHSDYVFLPYDFDIKFGADVHSIDGLRKAMAAMSQHAEATQHAFRPWFWLESNPYNAWRATMHNHVPEFDNEYFRRWKVLVSERYPVAWDYGKHFEYHTYEYASSFLRPSDEVLDLACGWGEGSQVLAKWAAQVDGIDLSEEQIVHAVRNNRHTNVRYRTGDAQSLPFQSDSKDVVVSVHTMEHLPDDLRFLDEVRRVLKPGGRLIIEVPTRMTRPFSSNREPVMPGHIREYKPGELRDKVAQFLEVELAFGVSRGHYCDFLRTRNAALLVAHKMG